MFNKTANIKSWLKNKVNVSLGTDSPMSGAMNILDEISFAKHIYQEMYNESLDARTVFHMITCNAAKAFRIPAGTLDENMPANFVITKKVVDNPYENILNLKLSDISLVVVNGKPTYGDIKFSPLLENLKIQHWKVELEGESKFLAVRGSLKMLKKIKTTVGYFKYLPYLPMNID